MKARLIRDLKGPPSERFPSPWECSVCPESGIGAKRTQCPKCESPVRQKSAVIPKGTVLDVPDAYRLVQMGVAEPADEECQRRANRTPNQMVVAQYAYERTSLGIHPEDYGAYESGEMVGYNPDGSFIPGPAFTGDDDEEADGELNELDTSEDEEEA